MKQIKCELCGSIDLVKQDGVYVCQYCGTRYSGEEEKKPLIDSVTEVIGKVKIDNSEQLANLYQVARRAKNDNHAEIAAKHYEMILADDPNSWEAVFYTVYFKAMQGTIAEIPTAATSIYNCTNTVLGLIKDTVNDETEQEQAVKEVAIRVMDISKILFNSAKNNYYDSSFRTKYIQEYLYRAFSSIYTAFNLGNQLESFFGDKKYACELAIKAWKLGIKSFDEVDKEYTNIRKKDNSFSSLFSKNDITISLFNGKETIYIGSFDIINDVTPHYEDKIVKYDPLYLMPKQKFITHYNGKQGDLKISGSGHLWVAGSEIYSEAKDGGLPEELVMKIADIVSMVKNSEMSYPTLTITDKNGNFICVNTFKRNKIISEIEKNRKKLGCPSIGTGSSNNAENRNRNEDNVPPAPVATPNDGKSWLKTLLLCLFLGLIGIHRFYTKNTVIGIIQLLTLGCCGIWTFIDLMIILVGSYKDGNGNELVNQWKWQW
ncbi:MAG: NINE protein [Tannerella sp.]|jgi:TM2 domain-containing membrane protein YozV|nr:NINE protein [Tannerella sp.]